MALALACGADHFERAVRRIARMWSHIRAGQVYHADSLHVMQSGTLAHAAVAGLGAGTLEAHAAAFVAEQRLLERLLAQVVPLVRLPLHPPGLPARAGHHGVELQPRANM